MRKPAMLSMLGLAVGIVKHRQRPQISVEHRNAPRQTRSSKNSGPSANLFLFTFSATFLSTSAVR